MQVKSYKILSFFSIASNWFDEGGARLKQKHQSKNQFSYSGVFSIFYC